MNTMPIRRQDSAQPFYGPNYKISVMGCGGVGKSALSIQFVQGYFVQDYDPTIEDSYVKICTIDGQQCKLHVLDTAGQEEFHAMTDTFMKSSDGFILVFSFTDKHSFDAMKALYKQVMRVKDRDNTPIVLVGNKCDLPPHSRAVSSDEGKMLARELRLHYIETSAKVSLHVEQAFYDVTRLIKKFHEEERQNHIIKPKKKKNGCAIL